MALGCYHQSEKVLWCLKSEVEKLPYSVETSNINFDITKPQPRLFVTPDFAHLSLVLEQFANTMAIRTGGLKGIKKLVDSKNLGTIELSTGIQISGHFYKCNFRKQQTYLYTNNRKNSPI